MPGERWGCAGEVRRREIGKRGCYYRSMVGRKIGAADQQVVAKSCEQRKRTVRMTWLRRDTGSQDSDIRRTQQREVILPREQKLADRGKSGTASGCARLAGSLAANCRLTSATKARSDGSSSGNRMKRLC
jgi:hypothetical protein